MGDGRPRPRETAGRPTKLTPELQSEIVQAIKAGNYMETAAAYAGLAKSTFLDWMRRGRRERERLQANARAKPMKTEAPYLAFSDAITKALATAEVDAVTRITDQGKQNWQALAWRLERMMPEKYGRREHVDLNHGGAVANVNTQPVDLSKLTDEELMALEKIAERLSTDERGDTDES